MQAARALGLSLWWAGVVTLAVGCGGDDTSGNMDADGGQDAGAIIDGGPVCTEDSECSDGVYCNGVEVCRAGSCRRGAQVNCDDGNACTIDQCSEAARACRYQAPDLDNDGHADAFCTAPDGTPLGDDCDDEDPRRYPGNIEICDAENLDEDCDPTTFGDKDQDGDGAIDARCCNVGADDEMLCGTDCDDLKASVNPSASELCDLYDNDCDGDVDEEVGEMMYPDADFDGHGAVGSTAEVQCLGTPGYAAVADDCDDELPNVHAGQVEICDGIDNDCDLRIDENARAVFWFPDLDGDGFGGRLSPPVFSCAPVEGADLRDTDCADMDPAIHPGAVELCDGIDNNCDGRKTFRIANRVNDFEDDDDDGSPDFACGPGGNDCDDNDKSIGGNLVELCDGLDNDCDGIVDEGVADTVWYVDADGDGYGNERLPAVVYCAPLSGRSAYPGDCNDADPLIHPGAMERCTLPGEPRVDDNCNGIIDEAPCTTCGDGVVEGAEQCDERSPNRAGVCVDPDGVCNSNTAVDACRLDCRRAYCGDGVTDTGEGCDDGESNAVSGRNVCRPNCEPPPCGDGALDDEYGEICDDGSIYCRNDCTAALWSDGICAPIAADLGSAVGAGIVDGDTATGTSLIVIDPSDVAGGCDFTGAPPTGPEVVYGWRAPARLVYGFVVSNAGRPSRLTLGLFFNDPRFVTSCTEPWACGERAPGEAMLALPVRDEGMAIVVDSASAETFSLSIFPALCCASTDDTALSGWCFTAGTQADLDCALAATAASCHTEWTPACVETARSTCGYVCPTP